MKILKSNSAFVGFGSVLVLGVLSMPAFAADEVKPKPKKVEYVRFLDLLPEALLLDKGIETASFGLEAAKETQKASRSGWYPKADITLNTARQEDFNPNAANKKYNPTEAKIKVTQKLWDFGETSAAIKTSGLSRTMAEIGLNGAKNQAILKAAQAYIGLKKAYAQFKIARDSEAQLKKQTGIQDFRLSRGASVGTDVLQAKNALAGATTARVAADGGYRMAAAKFKSVFGVLPASVDALLPIEIPNLLIPKTEEEFKEAVMRNGDQLLRARTSYEMSMVNSDKSVAANFLPEFNFTAEMNYKGDAGGTLGGKNETIAKVEMTWPIELFGTQFNTHRATMLTSKGAAVGYAQAVKGVEDAVSSSWIGYQLAKLNRANVQNQVKIAEQFLRLSQMEVKKGRGKMNLVVNAQSALINARKALQDNTSDHAVQVYNILAQMGELSVAKLEDASIKESEMIKKSMDDYKKKVVEAQEKAKSQAEKKKKPGALLTKDQMKEAWGKLKGKIKGAAQQ